MHQREQCANSQGAVKLGSNRQEKDVYEWKKVSVSC